MYEKGNKIMSEKNFIIAGFGGQGVLLAGEVLANACMQKGLNVTWYPSYGAEMRGGTVNCEIVTSETEVSSVNKKDADFIVALCDGTAFSARVSLDTVANIRKAKQAIKKAFEVQLKGLGFGFVEILSTCPTNWKMNPKQAHDRVKNKMMPIFKPGIYKDVTTQVQE